MDAGIPGTQYLIPLCLGAGPWRQLRAARTRRQVVILPFYASMRIRYFGSDAFQEATGVRIRFCVLGIAVRRVDILITVETHVLRPASIWRNQGFRVQNLPATNLVPDRSEKRRKTLS